MKSLRAWVYSPYANKNEKLKRLFDYLYKYYPDYSSSRFGTEAAWKYVFDEPEKENDKALTRLLSRLYRLVERFIAIEAESRNEMRERWQVLRYHKEQNLPEHFQSQLKKMEDDRDKAIARDETYYYNVYLLESEREEFLTSRQDFRKGDVNFQKLSDTFDVYWVCKKLEQLCQMLNRKRVVKFDYKLHWKDELLSRLPQLDFLGSQPVRTWYYALELLAGTYEKDKFIRLKNIMLGDLHYLGRLEQRIIFTYLENLAVDIFTEKKTYYEELYSLYEYQLGHRLFYYGEYMVPSIFTNYVTVCLVIGKDREAMEFITAYGQDIMPEYEGKEDTIEYNKARVAFARKKYDDCLDYLNQMACNDIYTKIGERRMRLKLYYELEYWELFENLINSFRKFLVGSKITIPARHLQANRNFINYTFKVYQYLMEKEEDTQSLAQEISNHKILPERVWLSEKLAKK